MGAVTADREPYSVKRLEQELNGIQNGLLDELWPHIQCVADLVGNTNAQQHPIGPKDSSKEPKIPMDRLFSKAYDIKETINQFSINMGVICRELHPEFYETKESRL